MYYVSGGSLNPWPFYGGDLWNCYFMLIEEGVSCRISFVVSDLYVSLADWVPRLGKRAILFCYRVLVIMRLLFGGVPLGACDRLS